MHLTAPLYARPYLNRDFTQPTLSNALFGRRYWLITVFISIAIHFLIMHGLPWLTPMTAAPAGSAGVTASFKVLPTPAPVVSTPLPAIPPVPETPIELLPEPVKPKPIQKQKTPPKAEPVLQKKEIAQAEDYAIAEQTPEKAVEVPTAVVEPDPAAATDTDTQAMPSTATQQKTTNTASQPTSQANNSSPISTANPTARANQTDGLLDAYGRDLQRLCEQHKQYPSIAIRRNLEGSGSVLVTFNQDGKVISINIEQSTGQSSLDKQAVKMVEKSLKDLPLPAKLSGQVLTLSVPVAFRLEG